MQFKINLNLNDKDFLQFVISNSDSILLDFDPKECRFLSIPIKVRALKVATCLRALSHFVSQFLNR